MMLEREVTEDARRAPELPPSRPNRKEDTMSVADNNSPTGCGTSSEKKKRRMFSPEKKYQIFLEAQRGECPVGEILRREGLYSTDLARIQQKVKEGALERLADRPGRRKKTVSQEEYESLKKDLEEKERALAELAVELAILRKKTNGGSGER
jgi:transposase-like protein